ncbi:rifampicin resistance protein [Turkeypox virus]|uniref:62 kDa protein n=1 Tax=Turkeypox virus TaxID=336486 RepID=A0A0M3ZPJ6_9POXV|nr:rifampicin resistance protein [Turkeypox virus]ALA62402.1 rifampicin resistance protein [Turkeypox virus]
MNNSIINSVINSIDSSTRRTNIFSFDVQQPTAYMPQYVSINGYCDSKDRHECSRPLSISFDVRDQHIAAINYFIISIDLPEVTGEGKFAYIPYIGYKCIQHVTITCGDMTIWETDGEELFDKCIDDKIAFISGYCPELNDISTGYTPNDTIKEATTLYVYIKTPFDTDRTISSLKLVNSKITITVTFRNINDVIVYDSKFQVEKFVKEFVYSTELHLIAYAVSDIKPKPAYIEIDRKLISCSSTPTPVPVISDVYACTSMSVYVKPYCGMMENKFISYPGYKQSEADYIRAMVGRLLDDLVVVTDTAPRDFPSSASFVKVPPDGQITIQDVDIIIKIDNVPDDKDVYYHINLLVFSTRKNSSIYNISKKFSSIVGVYSPITDSINFSKVDHSVSITDASIPVSFWISQKNVYQGDNRSEYSKSKDLIVNDPYRKGIDMVNKTDIISRLEVRFGNEPIYTEISPITKVFNMLLTGSSVNVRKILFNLNPANIFRPTTLNANTKRGKDKLTVRISYADIDANNPIHYISKQLVVVCTDLYRIEYDGKINVSKITE